MKHSRLTQVVATSTIRHDHGYRRFISDITLYDTVPLTLNSITTSGSLLITDSAAATLNASAGSIAVSGNDASNIGLIVASASSVSSSTDTTLSGTSTTGTGVGMNSSASLAISGAVTLTDGSGSTAANSLNLAGTIANSGMLTLNPYPNDAKVI